MRTMRSKHAGLQWVAMMAVSMAGLLAGCGGGATPQTVASHPSARQSLATPTVLAKADLQYYWNHRLALGAEEQIEEMFSLDENVYFLTNESNLFAVDAKIGVMKWVVNITRQREHVFAPTHISRMRLTEKVGDVDSILNGVMPDEMVEFDAVLINTTTQLLVIDRNKGKVYRNFKFKNFSAVDRGVSDGPRFYVAASDGMYYCIDLIPAVNVWWREINNEIIKAPVAYSDGHVFFGTMNGTLRNMMADETGRRVWDRPLGSAITSQFYVDPQATFIATEGNRVYGISTPSGLNLWDSVPLKGHVRGPIEVGDLTIFQYADGAGLYAIKVDSGAVRWVLPEGRRILAIIEGDAYILDKDDNLKLLNEITGEVKASVPLRGLQLFATNMSAPAVYAARKDGRIFCIRPKSAGHMTLDMLKR